VNPDYFAGVVDNYYLAQGFSVATFTSTTKDTFYPIPYIAGHLSVSARFGAGVFAIFFHDLMGWPQRTALTLVIAFFLLLLPVTLYFFCRVVMLLEHRVAVLAAWLIGISGPVAMSYLYFYLGQNSGLPALPLVAAACFLMLVRPGWRTLLFAALLSNALFVNYFAMLPYALAPAGALGLYLMATRRLSIARGFGIAIAFLAITIALKLGNVAETMDSMRAWMNVIGQSLQGQFFLDFLTESFFPLFLGIFNYPTNPWYAEHLGNIGARATGIAIALLVLVLLAESARRWARLTTDKASRVFVLSAIVIYTLVWYRYSFQQQYGYAVFKMSSWLQFMVVPFIAFAFFDLRGRIAGAATLRARGALGAAFALCVFYMALNLVTSLRYDYNGTGRNTESGHIVNHFGTAGNRDYFEVAGAAARFVKPGQSIGLVFTDSIRNYWTSYYLRDFRLSILSHDTLPGDDENLPDVRTNMVVDYYGNVRPNQNGFLHGGTSDDFIMTWGREDLNQDIVPPRFAGPPLWQNGSFALYPKSEARDVLFTGRGFYRLEYFPPISSYFFPRILRWSADGAEFFLLHPSRPGEAYRLAFDAIVGYEYPRDSRTLEIWVDGERIQTLVVTHSGRVVTAPFHPGEGLHKIVVKILERNRPLPREIAVWNTNIPKDYRRLNVGFSEVEIVPPGAAPRAPAPLGARVGIVEAMHRYAREFDGLQLDGWLGSAPARFVEGVPAGATKLAIDGFVPGNLGFSMPYVVKVRMNGRVSDHPVAQPGPFSIEVPLEPGDSELALAVEPTQSRDTGEEAIRHKVLGHSLRLDALTFR
jgi:hypothetical protein